MTTTVRLREPSELIATLPYLLGYRIHTSLVVVCLRGRRLGLIQRFDLPPAGVRPEHDQTGDDASLPFGVLPAGYLSVLVDALCREDPSGVVLLAYDDRAGSGRSYLAAAAALCGDGGWPVVARLVVDGDRWWELGCADPACDDPQCCPPLGQPLPEDEDVPAVAECVGAGVSPLPDRDALAGLLEPGPESDGVARALARRSPRHRLQMASDAATWWLLLTGAPDAQDHQRPPRHEVVARAVAALRSVAFRDALIAWLAPGIVPEHLLSPKVWDALVSAWGPTPWGAPDRTDGRETLLACRERLLALARAVPTTEQAPVCTVVAAVCWWSGDGALALEAAHRALCADPEYALAGLLHELVYRGVAPTGSAP